MGSHLLTLTQTTRVGGDCCYHPWKWDTKKYRLATIPLNHVKDPVRSLITFLVCWAENPYAIKALFPQRNKQSISPITHIFYITIITYKFNVKARACDFWRGAMLNKTLITSRICSLIDIIYEIIANSSACIFVWFIHTIQHILPRYWYISDWHKIKCM